MQNRSQFYHTKINLTNQQPSSRGKNNGSQFKMHTMILDHKLIGHYYDGSTWEKDLIDVKLVHKWTRKNVSFYWLFIGEDKMPYPLETIQLGECDMLIDFIGHSPFVTSISLEDYLKFYHGYILKK